MKFDYCIGNPPYQLTSEKSANQDQANSIYIYQFFQFMADDIAKTSCLIYPFGWFDAPNMFNGLGNKILNDGHTKIVYAYEAANDKRYWYRTDKKQEPVFNDVGIPSGVSIVIREDKYNPTFKYMNRMYSDKIIDVAVGETVTPNPLFLEINKKLGEKRLADIVVKNMFNIESDFAERNPDKVSFDKNDFKDPIILITNNKSGKAGRATKFYTDRSTITTNEEMIDTFKVVTISAYPKSHFVIEKTGKSLEGIKQQTSKVVEIVDSPSAVGRTKIVLFSSKNKKECENFLKYFQTDFVAICILNEPIRSALFGFIIPLQDFSDNSDIDWNKSVEEINQQLYKKYKLTKEEINFIESHVKEMI